MDEKNSTLELLKSITTGAIKQSGPRYTESAHVDLEIEEVFDGLSRNDRFKNKILRAKDEMLRAFTNVDDEEFFKESESLAEKFIDLKVRLKLLGESLAKFDFAPNFAPLDLNLINQADAVHKASNELHSGLYSYKPNNRAGFISIYGFKTEFQQYEYYFRKFQSKIYEFHQVLKSDAFEAFCNPSLWITSAAGFGKTHLFCDFCKRALDESQPVFFLLGQQIPDGDIWGHFCRRLKISVEGTTSAQTTFLSWAKTTSQRFNRKVLVVIDALNEGIGKSFWPDKINELRTEISKHSYLGIVVIDLRINKAA